LPTRISALLLWTKEARSWEAHPSNKCLVGAFQEWRWRCSLKFSLTCRGGEGRNFGGQLFSALSWWCDHLMLHQQRAHHAMAMSASAFFGRDGGLMRRQDGALFNLQDGGLSQCFKPESPPSRRQVIRSRRSQGGRCWKPFSGGVVQGLDGFFRFFPKGLGALVQDCFVIPYFLRVLYVIVTTALME
jgi:hypothetical protein